VNLPLDVARRLRLAGLRAENIAMTQACSVCCHEFYSVRRQGRELPFRTFTAIILRP
jgi:copper oxidase (laccase) domain-containing protein